MTSDPKWPEVIHESIKRSLDGVHTAIPAIVSTYNAALQQVAVQPVIDGMPPLEDVPVAWPRGGGHFLHMPIIPTDAVLLVFCEQDFNPWRLGGIPLAPALLRRHGLFAYAIPGAAPDLSPIASAATYPGAVLGLDGGFIVHVGATGVDLGAYPATQAVALAAVVDSILSSLQGIIAAAVPVPNDGGAAILTALQAWAPVPTASTVVRCSA
jgi:hypothetical protein